MLETTNLKNISKNFALARNCTSFKENEAMRAIAYSMDLLLPGLYIWLLGFSFRIGGSVPDDIPYKYPGKIHPTGSAVPLCWNNKTGLPHSYTGIALVLPRYRIFTTYQGIYDPKQTSNTEANSF
ncbi:MAG: hypothetical protein V7L05_26915 [Nostoc sp.]|uniref:hypothetical protein n=1 Tax=Nostoc sp. TaxID=1180 RepID=UPI002FF49C76